MYTELYLLSVLFYIKNKRTCAMKSFSSNNYYTEYEVLIGRGRVVDANGYDAIFSPHIYGLASYTIIKLSYLMSKDSKVINVKYFRKYSWNVKGIVLLIYNNINFLPGYLLNE